MTTNTTEISQNLDKIKKKSENLRINDLTLDDQKLLNQGRRKGEPTRLELVWAKEFTAHSATLWRRNRTRELYWRILDTNAHLFLAFLLTVPPTECISECFGPTIEHLTRLENYEPYRLNLSQTAKSYFESTALDNGFTQSNRYRTFMADLFPLEPQSLEEFPSNVHSSTLKRKYAPTDNEPHEYRPRATVSLSPIYSNDSSACQDLHDSQNNKDVRQTIASNKAHSTTAPKEKVYEKAPPQNLGRVFDPYMCGAIERVKVTSDGMTSVKAAVTMVFPSWALLDCLMSFIVDASKVEYLAMALLNVRVETVENVRYVSMKGGVRVQPNPEIILKGVLEGPISEVFGSEIHEAITACCMRGKELEVGNDATDCVSMAFSNDPSEGATINLALGLEEGTQIRKQLFT